jgi:hypothetical protein
MIPTEFTLWDHDLRPFVLKECARANCSPKHFQLQEIKVHATVTAQPGAFEDAMKTDPLLLQKMEKAGKQVVEEDLAKLMAYWVGMAETDISKIEANNTLTAQVKQGQIQARLQALPQNLAQTKIQILPKVEAAAKRVWEDLCRTQAAYRKYLIRCGISIAANTVKIVTTAIATVGTAGAALAMGIIGAASGAAGIAKQLYNMSKDAEKVEKQLGNSVVSVLKKRPDASKWNTFVASAETIARKFGPTDILVDSEIKCLDLNELYGHKLEGLDVKSHDAAVSLNTALEKSDELRSVLQQEGSRMAAGAGGGRVVTAGPQGQGAQIAGQLKALEKLEVVVNETIEKVIGLSKRVEMGSKIHKSYEELIDQMRKNNIPKFIPALAEVAPIVATMDWHKLATEATLKLADCSDTIEEVSLKLAEEFGPEVVNYTYEKFKTVTKGA